MESRMLISLRGTSGSGKSTIARKILDCYETIEPEFIDNRKRPIKYHCLHGKSHQPVDVIGHYEAVCGGCDTIASYEVIFDEIRKSADTGVHVFFEGLLISAEYRYTSQLLKDGYDLRIIRLSTPIDLCIESINERRKRRNPDAGPVKERNTISKDRAVTNSLARLNEETSTQLVWEADRVKAEQLIKEWLCYES